jgi:Trk K+ transport system NAD-binding subunit
MELLEEIGIHRSELVISTLTDEGTNLLLAGYITEQNDQAVFICPASTLDEAEKLYAAGAAYVLMPHYIGTEHLTNFLNKNGNNRHAFSTHRKQQLEMLKKLEAA